MNLEYICNIFDNKQSILVLCSHTVKEPAVSSDSRVYKTAILLHWCHA